MLMFGAVLGAAGAIVIVIYLAVVVASIVGTVKIIQKAGYSGWFVLLGLVPVVNIVMFFVFAFSDWPVHKELRQYRQGGYGPGGYATPPWPAPPGGGSARGGPAGYGSAGPAGYVPGTPSGYGGGPAFPSPAWPPSTAVPPEPGGWRTPPSVPPPGEPETAAPGPSWPDTPPPPDSGG